MGAFISEPQEEPQHGGEATWRRDIAGQSVVVDLVRNLGMRGVDTDSGKHMLESLPSRIAQA
eukprot:1067264-Alexandrium_andersonii.AAC.1